MRILKLFICFSFLSITATRAQLVDGVVEYVPELNNVLKSVVDKQKDNMAKSKVLKMEQMLIDASKQITYKCEFSGSISKFSLVGGMALDDKGDLKNHLLNLAILYTGRGKYYTNLQTGQQLTIKNNYGQDYNILGSIEKRPWELTKTTKKIGNFTCYKATYIKKLPKRNYTVVAWYTPQIPLPFGPLDHGGNLPGLILELHLPMASYYAKSVTLNPKNQPQITWPTNIHTISKEKYRQQGEVVLKAIKN